MTYTIVTAMLVLGGAAVGNALTLVSTFLLIYTLFGGLKSTFFPDYLNSAFLFTAILIFVTILF